jgi:(S)-ureidoglycine aminohydrolase
MSLVSGKLGETRSVLRREYLLHTPDAFVRTPLPEIAGGVAIVHASPRLGAGFLQYTAELEAGGELAAVPEQRFVWVLEGEISVELGGGARTGFRPLTQEQKTKVLRPGDYVYLPDSFGGGINALSTARLAIIEKRYEALEGVTAPSAFVGSEADVEGVALGGDTGLIVKSLLPADTAFDFAVNTMTYAAGTALAQVEVHVMEHGLLMLEGRGTYLLGKERFAVESGDFIWMAPYCPQWFVAEGDGPAKYLIYKDWNRRPRI